MDWFAILIFLNGKGRRKFVYHVSFHKSLKKVCLVLQQNSSTENKNKKHQIRRMNNRKLNIENQNRKQNSKSQKQKSKNNSRVKKSGRKYLNEN